MPEIGSYTPNRLRRPTDALVIYRVHVVHGGNLTSCKLVREVLGATVAGTAAATITRTVPSLWNSVIHAPLLRVSYTTHSKSVWYTTH